MRKTILEWVGGATILGLILALFSYGQKVEHRITVVEEREVNAEAILMEIRDDVKEMSNVKTDIAVIKNDIEHIKEHVTKE